MGRRWQGIHSLLVGDQVMAIIKDDRTEEEKRSHAILVIGTDKFMSGWGLAKGGLSYAAWACKKDDVE